MKKVKSFRIDASIEDAINAKSQELGISCSQLIELACLRLIDNKNLLPPKASTLKRQNPIMIKLNVDNPSFKRLYDIVQKKNTTLSKEIYYRLSASLDSPVFDTQELQRLGVLQLNLNRYGNLLKLAIDQKIPFDNNILTETQSIIHDIKTEVSSIINSSKKRTF